MRIDRISPEFLAAINEEIGQLKRARKGSSDSLPDGETEGVMVTLSEELSSQIEELQPPPREKVEEIKRALAEGTYSIDVHRISEAILKDILGE
ncbi:flagellar biosynthesis anti-sigma factor FlgM [Phorcysia thermohydrogeniphila]|uniref:Negative regulator of flagellin synthesis FlgM n=1 Tax=Phorcysia thermohydrogeniphila TaxID=936138 RepID=A0A4R1GPY1_9BACT|nr:flagellar biosynthesis anti-sigma factor FlgM [Phorcysia thermohydrogeniphila]TCK06562.1 negative regulator of flagellin synthesis FlgM [Phorcysia thermohydrogeniphila]